MKLQKAGLFNVGIALTFNTFSIVFFSREITLLYTTNTLANCL